VPPFRQEIPASELDIASYRLPTNAKEKADELAELLERASDALAMASVLIDPDNSARLPASEDLRRTIDAAHEQVVDALWDVLHLCSDLTDRLYQS
jgi:hypothetical protein